MLALSKLMTFFLELHNNMSVQQQRQDDQITKSKYAPIPISGCHGNKMVIAAVVQNDGGFSFPVHFIERMAITLQSTKEHPLTASWMSVW